MTVTLSTNHLQCACLVASFMAESLRPRGLSQAHLPMGILQARRLQRVAMDLPELGIEPASPKSPSLAGGFFTTRATLETHHL